MSRASGMIVALSLLVFAPTLGAQGAPEARLLRYPHVHQNKVAFTYLGDIWTANNDGSDIRRLTVHTARDAFPRFSPDGRWIAFSSNRYGNLDVFIVPVEGGQPTRLTFHSTQDQVLDWTPDGQRVLFSSNRGERWAPTLYTVDLKGGMPVSAGVDIGLYGSYSPDGNRLAFNRKSQVYWRKGYRGSNQSDVTVMNGSANGGTPAFTDLTDFNGMDTWPMWGRDGFIYFVSDREGNATDVYRVAEKGGNAERVTSYSSGDVRWPAISADGNTIAFEHDFGLWLLDPRTKQARRVPIRIAAEVQGNLAESRTLRSEVDDYALAPNGRRIAFSIHGEVFTAPVEEGDLRQITGSAWRDVNPVYSPDGSRIAFGSDSSGREEIWVAPTEGGPAERITNLDALKQAISWAPDGKSLAYTASDNRLRVYSFDTKRTAELVASRYGNISSPVWSPDGRWIAYSRPDVTRQSDLYIVAAAGGEEHRVTFDSYNDAGPEFSPDGKTLYFRRTEGVQSGLGGPALAQLWAVGLEKLGYDPDDAEMRPADDTTRRPGGGRAATPPREIAIDWAGLERRTRRLTTMPFSVSDFAVSPDGRTVIFATQEQVGARTSVALFTIGSDGRRVNRLASLAAPGGDQDDGQPAGGGFGGGVSGLTYTPDGRTVYFQRGNAIYALATAGQGNPQPRRVNFTARVDIDLAAERTQMFDDAWRTMKYRFYDAEMHGRDWDAMRAKYRPLLPHVGDRDELLNIVNEMIGELNASHTGSAPPPGGGAGGTTTMHLGLDLVADPSGRYRVTHVYQHGPADKDWVKVSVGDYLIAIDGTPVRAGDNYWKLLSDRLNRRVMVSFNGQPTPDGAWTARINPVPVGQFNQLRYERWVSDRKEMTTKLSNGRVGYLHIQAMNQPSLRRFEKELRENRDKEALIIDQRWNGGGNIEQELLQILVQRQYQVWQPRGTETNSRPFMGYFGPKVVLQNWRSASNAEMFPAGFKALGLGTVIGEPTMGAVIGTGSYSLIDGSTVRTPQVGVYLADEKQTNMENYGVQPDILVVHRPEDELAGRDPQLERAVQELLKKIGAKRPAATSSPR
ncbi:MAG: S41 family peptidase [Gemmatimonadales bacterium]